MIKKSFRVFHGKELMPWSTGTAVWGAGGFVFLSGAEGIDSDTDAVVEGIGAQTRLAMEKIKERLEEFGTSLDNICHMWVYIAGPEFPDAVVGDPRMQEFRRVRNEFWDQYCPQFRSDRKPPASTLLGVSSLARKGMHIEITVVAALPPLT